MPVKLRGEDLERTLEQAYLLAIGEAELPATWLRRAEQLAESPSVGFIAAVGSVLLAKATDEAIDAFVIQVREDSAGAFNLRAAATALGKKKRAFGMDIGSSSDRDPINHGTLVGSTRWDVALDRIREDHKPFFQLILTWLSDVNRMSQEDALLAFAAYVRVRRSVSTAGIADRVPADLGNAPALSDLIEVIEGFVRADPERGARGMALAGAAYRTAGFDVSLPSRNDPRRIDIPIARGAVIVVACEVKQVDATEATADTLAADAAALGIRRALLSVLPPGVLADFDRRGAIRRAERDHAVVLRVVSGVRELVHETLMATSTDVERYCARLPRAFAEALNDMRVDEASAETWAAIAGRWAGEDL